MECTLRFTEDSAGKPLQVDRERAAQLIAAAEEVAGLIAAPAALNPLEVLAWPGVLVGDAADPQALNKAALGLFQSALDELREGRRREGEELARLLGERLDGILDEIDRLREQVPHMLAAQRQKILDRFAELAIELDAQRVEQEMVLLAQKSDVAEELDRLGTHVAEVRRVLAAGGAAGRGWTSSCRNSTARPTRSAPRPSTRAARRGGESQGADRADARAGPEHRMSALDSRPDPRQAARIAAPLRNLP